jgi:hypothetical protein
MFRRISKSRVAIACLTVLLLIVVAAGIHILYKEAFALNLTFTVTITDTTPPDDGPVTGLNDVWVNIYDSQHVFLESFNMWEVEDGVYSRTREPKSSWFYWKVWCDVTIPQLSPGWHNVWNNPEPFEWFVEDGRQ